MGVGRLGWVEAALCIAPVAKNGAGSGACSEQPSDWRREPRIWADEGDAD